MSGAQSQALAEALAGIAAECRYLIVGKGDSVERIVERAAEPVRVDFLLIAIGPDVGPLARAMLIAAIGPLAIGHAPATRLCALDVTEGAALADVVAAARFLGAARSTTGQVLKVESGG